MRMIDWFLLMTGVFLSALGGIFLKLGAMHVDHSSGLINAIAQALMQWRLYIGGFCYFVPVIIWIYMLKRVEITFLQPLFAMVYIVTPMLAIFMLNETVSATRWMGILIIGAGIAVVARS